MYGNIFPVYNIIYVRRTYMHYYILYEDSMRTGSLDNCAFRFKNHLHILKKSIRGTKNPLVELINRI